jgi:hypothetical protein
MFTPKPGVAARIVAFSILLTCFGPALSAQPPLTLIQDVLYKADGARFTGYVHISWNSFEAGDTSNIATQFRSVRIVDGNFSVKLVPTTNADPPATYTAVYNSDGKVQFQETWAVPPSTKRLRIRDVRISTPSNLDSGGGGPVQESDVVGLVADLNSRPTEGPGYATGRVLVSNSIGELEAVSGNLSDCVHVDGSSGPCGSASSGGTVPGYVDSEVPGGVVDGANATFSLAGQPNPAASLALYRNGVFQKAGFDYSLSGGSILFVTGATPQPGDTLLASYRVAGVTAPLTEETAAPSVETLCSNAGTSTMSAGDTTLGACVVPAGTLKAGDRVEIRFDYAHTGAQSGFLFAITWGSSPMLSRTTEAGESLATGRAEAAVGTSSTQLSAQSWGTSLALGTSIGAATDSLAAPLTIRLSGNLLQPSGDSLSLTGFTVLRYSR